MNKEEKYFVLQNGYRVPVIGFGTGMAKGLYKHPIKILKYVVKNTAKSILIKDYRKNNKYTLKTDLKKDRTLREIVKVAVDSECKLIDTARAYQFSENYVGEILFKGKAPYNREDVCIITKVTNTAQRNNTILEGLQTSLTNLGVDYVDIYLLHWPQTDTYIDAWKVMEEIYYSGKAKAIGVCNCHIQHLELLKKSAKIMPMINEIECHPLLQQKELKDYCRKNNIQMIAYAPTGKMNKQILESEVLRQIAKDHKVEISQVILRWHYQLGVISIPNTTSKEHIIQNLNIWHFELTEAEMKSIDALDCNYRIWPNPDNCDFTKL